MWILYKHVAEWTKQHLQNSRKCQKPSNMWLETICIQIREENKANTMAHAFNPSTLEAEAGRFLWSSLVYRQPCLENQKQNTKTQTNKNNKTGCQSNIQQSSWHESFLNTHKSATLLSSKRLRGTWSDGPFRFYISQISVFYTYTLGFKARIEVILKNEL